MKKFWLTVIIVLGGFVLVHNLVVILANRTQKQTMLITSPAFNHNEFIPAKYTCDGGDANPELRFAGVPENARALALIMDDPDAPVGTFTHWLVWNIDPGTTVIAEHSVPERAVEGLSGANKVGYIGPCPPSGTHRYFFKLYALDAPLALSRGAGKGELETEIQKHLLSKAELVGLYERKQ